MRPTIFLPAAALALLGGAATAATPSPLAAQGRDRGEQRAPGVGRDTARWLRRCNDGYGGDDDEDRARHCEVRDTRLPSSTRSFALDGRENGGVSVIGWAGDSVLLRAYVEGVAPSDSEAARIARDTRVVVEGGHIHAEGPETRGRRWWVVSYELFVPRRGVDVTATTHNGPVALRDVSGRMNLEAVNGPIALDNVGGDVKARTQNGPLSIDLAGTTWEGAGLDAETSNGPVALTIPDGYSAKLETGTVNGPMQIGFPITVQGRIGRRVETTLGNGGATVRAVTTNGPVVVRKG